MDCCTFAPATQPMNHEKTVPFLQLPANGTRHDDCLLWSKYRHLQRLICRLVDFPALLLPEKQSGGSPRR